MNQKIILFLLCAVPLFCMAQNRLARAYSYDAAGNRTACAVINLPPPAPPMPPDTMIGTQNFASLQTDSQQTASQTTSSEPLAEYFVETIAQTEIKIYPNPTTEKITLEFSGGVETQRIASLRLYSLSGQLLQEQPVHSATTTVSLAGFPQGVYILKVNVNGVTEDWKVIKN